ncbi:hypothetical protein [Mesorhizobium sp. Z1-4]|nr:hypothetical protein [Mesorhizobium sp. Z1-4]
MKLSRRGFFGIGAGAVASGPTLAKKLSDQSMLGKLTGGIL